MKREIKFRAYDTEREMYVPQGEIIFKDYGETYFEVSPNCQEYIHDKCHNGEPQYNRFIIEQYTGLKDINDVKIYEGDILHKPFQSAIPKFIVEWNNEKACFTGIPLCSAGKLDHKEFTIIGNIHENPELL